MWASLLPSFTFLLGALPPAPLASGYGFLSGYPGLESGSFRSPFDLDTFSSSFAPNDNSWAGSPVPADFCLRSDATLLSPPLAGQINPGGPRHHACAESSANASLCAAGHGHRHSSVGVPVAVDDAQLPLAAAPLPGYSQASQGCVERAAYHIRACRARPVSVLALVWSPTHTLGCDDGGPDEPPCHSLLRESWATFGHWGLMHHMQGFPLPPVDKRRNRLVGKCLIHIGQDTPHLRYIWFCARFVSQTCRPPDRTFYLMRDRLRCNTGATAHFAAKSVVVAHPVLPHTACALATRRCQRSTACHPGVLYSCLC